MSTKAKQNQHADVFAQIASRRIESEKKVLIEPQPPKLPQRFLPIKKSDPLAFFKPLPKLDTPAKLHHELKRQRRNYSRFLQDFAPKPQATRTRMPLKTFDWRIETPADLNDFKYAINGKGRWQQVEIPHYGGPLGRATTYYRTTFLITKAMLKRGTLFVCFKGVDYKAHVFINGAFVGSHEGFFAPFEFEFTKLARIGPNTLLVKVENDAICGGNTSWGDDGYLYEGDKIYAATGCGYDDPQTGWHHCPPGMGIYQDVFIEARRPVHINDIFVRSLSEKGKAEAWVEVYNCHKLRREISIELSVFGQNFRKTVFRNRRYKIPEPVGPTTNYFRLPFEIPNPKIWDIETPWLYQIQSRLYDKNNKILDIAQCQFGMRFFSMDRHKEPKGRFFLNGRQIRLRGANTMGHMQQCVIKKNWKQLIDDILLAKICHLNFFRLTQRPVQSEIYDFCDRLGIMTQTDLPLFGVLRRNQFTEAVRQASEMERLVRSHPCNVVVTYINEPYQTEFLKFYRYLTRDELTEFFRAADRVIRLHNPDRVIKPVDGDFDPPAPGLPDNHCYNAWYNGQGLDLGKLHKGYWQKIKPGWFYGCGEFGAEGLDPLETMRKYYPKHWLPQNAKEEKTWTPSQIIKAQTGNYHYMWFDSQDTLAGWVQASQAHQAWAVQLMTEAFRRDRRMNSFAVHLFIDAFPAGWMKAIMDVDRRPKPAYFAYREALSPLLVNLRTDRYAFFSGEPMPFEAWVCNDSNTAPPKTFLHYQLEIGEKAVFAGRARTLVPKCSSSFQGFLRLSAPKVKKRSQAIVRLGLLDAAGKVLNDCHICIDIFPEPAPIPTRSAFILGASRGKAAQLARQIGLKVSSGKFARNSVILVDDFDKFAKRRKVITEAVRKGATVVFIELPAGKYKIAGSNVAIEPCGMGARHFVSRRTGHHLVAGFKPNDFKFWYDPKVGYVTPILETTFTAPGWDAILTSGNGVWRNTWKQTLAAAEKKYGSGYFRICQVTLAERISTNPVAQLFGFRLLETDY